MHRFFFPVFLFFVTDYYAAGVFSDVAMQEQAIHRGSKRNRLSADIQGVQENSKAKLYEKWQELEAERDLFAKEVQKFERRVQEQSSAFQLHMQQTNRYFYGLYAQVMTARAAWQSYYEQKIKQVTLLQNQLGMTLEDRIDHAQSDARVISLQQTIATMRDQDNVLSRRCEMYESEIQELQAQLLEKESKEKAQAAAMQKVKTEETSDAAWKEKIRDLRIAHAKEMEILRASSSHKRLLLLQRQLVHAGMNPEIGFSTDAQDVDVEDLRNRVKQLQRLCDDQKILFAYYKNNLQNERNSNQLFQ